MMTYSDYLKDVMQQNEIKLEDGVKPTQKNLMAALEEAGVAFPTKLEFDAINDEQAKESVGPSVNIEAAQEAITAELSNAATLKKRLKDSKDPAIKRETVGELQMRQKRIEKMFAKTLLEVEKMKSSDTVLSFLKWSRSRRLVKDGTKAYHLLNALLADSIDEDSLCECFVKAPAGLNAVHGEEYKFSTHWDQERQQLVYTTFIPVTKTGEDQLTVSATQKINRGIQLTEDDYLPNRIDVKACVLKESEWAKYFRAI